MKIGIELTKSEIEFLSEVYQGKFSSTNEDLQEKSLAFLKRVGTLISKHSIARFHDFSDNTQFFSDREKYLQNINLMKKFPNSDLFEFNDILKLKTPLEIGLTKNELEPIGPENFKSSQILPAGETVEFSGYTEDGKECQVSKRIGNLQYVAMVSPENLEFALR